MLLSALLWATVLSLCGHVVAADEFREALLLRPLSDGKMLVHFRFTSSAPASPLQMSHFDVLPMSLSLIAHQHDVQHLTLAMSAGRWRAERWGISPAPAPSGLVVHARFGGNAASVDTRWRGLVHALGGLLCASMGFVVKGDTNTLALSPLERYGTLPRELVCTENLTPWLHLLPCRNAAGFGAAIAPELAFDSDHHSLSLDYDRDAHTGSVTLVQQLVFVSAASSTSWNNRNLFGSAAGLLGCDVARESVVTVDHSRRPDARGATAAGVHHMQSVPFHVDISLPRAHSAGDAAASTSPLTLLRHVAGVGQYSGTLVSRIATVAPRTVRFVETLPWHVRVHYHTLRVTVDGVAVTPLPIVRLHPSTLRGAPSLLELQLRLPANSTAAIAVDFRRAFLRIAEHPPDAHHGFHLPAARVTDVDDPSVTVYSDELVVLVPLPDFSMPFNVVALSGIVLGFYFGALLRAVTARYSALKRGDTGAVASQRPIARLARLLLRLIDRQ